MLALAVSDQSIQDLLPTSILSESRIVGDSVQFEALYVLDMPAFQVSLEPNGLAKVGFQKEDCLLRFVWHGDLGAFENAWPEFLEFASQWPISREHRGVIHYFAPRVWIMTA